MIVNVHRERHCTFADYQSQTTISFIPNSSQNTKLNWELT